MIGGVVVGLLMVAVGIMYKFILNAERRSGGEVSLTQRNTAFWWCWIAMGLLFVLIALA